MDYGTKEKGKYMLNKELCADSIISEFEYCRPFLNVINVTFTLQTSILITPVVCTWNKLSAFSSLL